MIRNIFDKFIGETEKNTTRLIRLVKEMVPAIIYIDEFDQWMGNREEISTDSGVTRRLRGRILEVLSDTSLRGKLIWIGATNRPDLLDQAVLRPGRFDLKIPFLPASSLEEIEKIFDSIIKRYNIKLKERPDLSKFKGSTQAEIERIVLIANNNAIDSGKGEITKEDFEFAFNDFLRSNSIKEEDIIRTLRFVSSKKFIPPYYYKFLISL